MKTGHQEIFSPIVRELKRVAFRTLLQRIKSPTLPPRTVLLPSPLVVR